MSLFSTVLKWALDYCKGFSHFFNKNNCVFEILPFEITTLLIFEQQAPGLIIIFGNVCGHTIEYEKA